MVFSSDKFENSGNDQFKYRSFSMNIVISEA
ncbi:hypothetical protein [Plasmodium yoelii yoelii]|uniref:Uncharacterized protein n=1 Tax=Plasmodium yoelii yoelii TaxID=73239 RepID=Q7RPZ3_PLAYO|nr:hypothetical protein [Plasmodium yoelii yoelii]